MRSTLILFSLFSTLLLPSQSQVQIPRDGDAVLLVIRIVDGPVEVTSKTQVKVYLTGTRDDSLLVNFAVDSGHLVYVTPGIYDVQAIQQHENKIVNISMGRAPHCIAISRQTIRSLRGHQFSTWVRSPPTTVCPRIAVSPRFLAVHPLFNKCRASRTN